MDTRLFRWWFSLVKNQATLNWCITTREIIYRTIWVVLLPTVTFAPAFCHSQQQGTITHLLFQGIRCSGSVYLTSWGVMLCSRVGHSIAASCSDNDAVFLSRAGGDSRHKFQRGLPRSKLRILFQERFQPLAHFQSYPLT